MIFSKEQLLNLKNAYEALNEDEELIDNLLEHRTTLNSLSPKQQQNLASNIVFNCPKEEFQHLNVEGLKKNFTEDSFYSVLERHIKARRRMERLSNSKNPHSLFLEEHESLPDCAELSLKILNEKEIDIAIRLARSTPEGQRSELIRKVQNDFPNSTFATKLGAAFVLRRELNKLLGETPHNFFLSSEFNKESYLEFASLFDLIDDKEEEIIVKLENTPEAQKSHVLKTMGQIFPNSNMLKRTRELFQVSQQTNNWFASLNTENEDNKHTEIEEERIHTSSPF